MWTPNVLDLQDRRPREKQSHAVFILDEFFEARSKSWARRMVFTYDGVDYPFVLDAINVADEAEARAKLFDPASTDAVQKLFLTEVTLEVKH